MNDQEKQHRESLAQAGRLQQQLVEQLKDLPVMVQLDALLATYVHVGIQHRQLHAVAPALMQLAGNLLFGEVKAVKVARSPDPEATHHAAPASLQ
ncbi:MAG: hypothetical protein B7Y42_00380 [Polaromonas sp. 28-63-22]|nr:MAG: hypothetical protein B7Y42_00380 [Polaromonas sp. 28-63-22]